MRIGLLTDLGPERLRRVHRLGFASFAWVDFHQHPVASASRNDWKSMLEPIRELMQELGLRLSAIGALYQNPLAPAQRDFAKAIFSRAFEAAEFLGAKTVAGFPGAILESYQNERGGISLYRDFDAFIPQMLDYWAPLAREAADHGVRIAFENCPQGPFHLPVMGYNMFGKPDIWEKVFSDARSDNLGLEWDASHLICQLIDPVQNIHQFGSRIFHVHAKDAFIDWPLLHRYGICHHGVAEHRFPGLGQANWGEIVHALIRAGYDSDLNIEGRHDPVYRDHPPTASGPLAGQALEDQGCLIGLRTLANFVPPETVAAGSRR